MAGVFGGWNDVGGKIYKKFQIFTIDSNYPVTITVRRCAMSKILIVEDDLSIQALLHDFIQEAGYSVVLTVWKPLRSIPNRALI